MVSVTRMEFFATFIVSSVLLLTAAGMLHAHRRTWKAFCDEERDEDEYDYRRRQFRRRMQTSAMLAVLAVALAGGHAATLWWIRSGWFAAVFWIAVMLLACWVGLLALADIWATNRYYRLLRDNYMIQRAKLEAELRRNQPVDDDGQKKNDA